MDNEELISKLEEIVKTVNLFKSEKIQERVFDMLLNKKDDKKIKSKIISKRKTSTKTSTKRGKKYDLLGELNLQPKDKKSLRDFMNEKKPKDNQERFAVIIYYFKKVLNLKDNITINHIYTAFKEINTKVPTDIMVGLSQASSRKGWFETKDMNDLSLNVGGENFVEHDLPKNK